MPVDIAFITVNYNTVALVEKLADFLRTLDAPFTFSFTVVDNDSKDGSQEFLQSRPDIHYLQSGGNLGYGRAINRGVAATDSAYVCVTNTDVVLNREALVKLWRFLEERPEAGVAAPRITYADGRDQGMVFHRSLFSHYANWYGKFLARRSKRKIANSHAPVRVDGVMGAFFLIRRTAIPPPSLFDEDFFFFYEDTALSHTLANRGVACFVLPDVTIVHLGGQSRSENSIASFYKSKYLYLKKFYGPSQADLLYYRDLGRIRCKCFFYSLFSLVTSSDLIRSKERYYKLAWDSVRPK